MFLVILLILFGFWEFLSLPKRNAVALRKSEATQPVKSFSNKAGILRANPQIVASNSINFASAKNVMARSYRYVAKMAGCLAALAQSIFCNLGSIKVVSDAWQTRYAKNREAGKNDWRSNIVFFCSNAVGNAAHWGRVLNHAAHTKSNE